MASLFQLRQWIKAGKNPLARALYRMVLGSRTFSMPVIPFIHRPLYQLRSLVLFGTEEALRIFWYTPLFQSRLEAPAKRLNLWNGMPVVVGSLRISMGEDCCICGQSTYTGRTVGKEVPQLIFGRNIGIGWQTTISVGTKVVIGDNVRISGRALLSGYPGHPIDAAARAKHLPDTEDQIGDIILEDDVWLGTGCTVSAGVTIGRGTIVAANSTVTKSLPPYVLAAGSPATIKRSIAPHEANAEMRQALAEARGSEVETKAAKTGRTKDKTVKDKTAKDEAA